LFAKLKIREKFADLLSPYQTYALQSPTFPTNNLRLFVGSSFHKYAQTAVDPQYIEVSPILVTI
jgi:hypothetical protein